MFRKQKLSLLLVLILGPLSIMAQNDLALRLSVAKKQAKRSEKVEIKVTVYNQKRRTTTGIKVNVPIPNGAMYVTDNVQNAYDPTPGMWYIGTMLATTDSISMTLTVEIKTEGVVYCFSEIAAMNEPDADSTPNNSMKYEDDSDNATINVPITMCSNELNLMVGAQQTHAKYQWFRDGEAVLGATAQNFTIKKPGSYYCQVVTDSTKTISAPISLDTISAPMIITAPRTIQKGEAVFIERFALDQNIFTREIGSPIAFYASLSDANNGQNPMTNLLVAPTQTTTFYVKKTTKECKDIKPLVINVTQNELVKTE
jgi:Domain of unknown function DUF11